MNALLELADRVEQATGPDRLLNAQVALALGIGPRGGPLPEEAQLYLDRYPNARISRPDQYRGYLWGKGGPDGSFGWSALPFTSSLDAAMTLVPENCVWNLQIFGDGTAGADCAEFIQTADYPATRAATPALALTAAALRARAASA